MLAVSSNRMSSLITFSCFGSGYRAGGTVASNGRTGGEPPYSSGRLEEWLVRLQPRATLEYFFNEMSCLDAGFFGVVDGNLG